MSGFVSGSEIAYFSLTPQQLDEIAETSRGKKVVALLEAPEKLLATILIANNLVNVTIVVLCNFALGPIFDGMSAVARFCVADCAAYIPYSAVRRNSAQSFMPTIIL